MRTYTDPETALPVELSEAEFAKLAADTLRDWEATQFVLKTAKEREARLRRLYVAMQSPTGMAARKGTQTVMLGNGYRAKITRKVSYGWRKDASGKTDINAVHIAQDEIDRIGNEGTFLADRLIRWTPELSLTEYNKLDSSNPTHHQAKSIIDAVIVVSDAMPTLEIVPPKDVEERE